MCLKEEKKETVTPCSHGIDFSHFSSHEKIKSVIFIPDILHSMIRLENSRCLKVGKIQIENPIRYKSPMENGRPAELFGFDTELEILYDMSLKSFVISRKMFSQFQHVVA